MRESRPSATALRVAIRRAAHQVHDRPLVFEDPLAMAIIGEKESGKLLDDHSPPSRTSRYLRAFLAVRSRLSEEMLAEAVSHGVEQCVILGAGLDTFGYRNPFPKLRVFEVDHPDTQSWKRECLANARIDVPPSLTYAPVDFERQQLGDGLLAAGWQPDAATYSSWLGVTMYLLPETVLSTLAFIASLPPGSGVTFDYAIDAGELSFTEKIVGGMLARRVAAAGEPFLSSFEPAAFQAALTGMGFHRVMNHEPDALNLRYFSGRTDGLKVGRIARIMVAWR